MTEGCIPWGVQHELAHGFHDQNTGFDDARVTALRSKPCESGKCKSVPMASGEKRERSGLTHQKESFAEITGYCLGSNDFRPFDAGELKRADPKLFALFEEIWGSLTGRLSSKPTAKP